MTLNDLINSLGNKILLTACTNYKYYISNNLSFSGGNKTDVIKNKFTSLVVESSTSTFAIALDFQL